MTTVAGGPSENADQGNGNAVVWDVCLESMTRATTRAITTLVEEFHRTWRAAPRDPSNVAELLSDIETHLCQQTIVTGPGPHDVHTVGEIVTARVMFQKMHRKGMRAEILQAEGEEETIPVTAETAMRRKPRRRRKNKAVLQQKQ